MILSLFVVTLCPMDVAFYWIFFVFVYLVGWWLVQLATFMASQFSVEEKQCGLCVIANIGRQRNKPAPEQTTILQVVLGVIYRHFSDMLNALEQHLQQLQEKGKNAILTRVEVNCQENKTKPGESKRSEIVTTTTVAVLNFAEILLLS